MKETRPMILAFWNEFLGSLPAGRPRPAACTVWSFGHTPELAFRLGDLVMQGIKTGTSSLVWEYESSGENLPKPGDVSIILDGEGLPLCVIQTSTVTICAFNQVTKDHAEAEGEGDRSLEYWRKVHWDVFSQTCASLGRQPAEDMPICCERFQLLYPKQPGYGD